MKNLLKIKKYLYIDISIYIDIFLSLFNKELINYLNSNYELIDTTR